VVKVDFLEEGLVLIISGGDLNEGQSIGKSLDELSLVHDPLGTLSVGLELVQPLDGELSVVDFQEEVAQFVILDSLVAVGIIPEDVGHDVEDIELVRLHELDEDGHDFLLIEAEVLVGIELNQQDKHAGTGSPGQVQVREVVRAHDLAAVDNRRSHRLWLLDLLGQDPAGADSQCLIVLLEVEAEVVVYEGRQEFGDPGEVLSEGNPTIVVGVNQDEELKEEPVSDSAGTDAGKGVPEDHNEVTGVEFPLTVGVVVTPSAQTEFSQILEEVDGEHLEGDAAVAGCIHMEDTLKHELNFLVRSLVKNLADQSLDFSGVQKLVVILVVVVVHELQQQPEQVSQSALVVFGGGRRGCNWGWGRGLMDGALRLADCGFDELKVLHIRDQLVVVLVVLVEDSFDLCGIDRNAEEGIGVVEKVNELFESELPLGTVLDASLFVASLESEFTAMSFE
jgi:hypothetical protein